MAFFPRTIEYVYFKDFDSNLRKQKICFQVTTNRGKLLSGIFSTHNTKLKFQESTKAGIGGLFQTQKEQKNIFYPQMVEIRK
jgi:hypothetical protein